MTTDEIVFPFGPADVQTLSDAATMTQEIKNTLTILQRLTGFGQAVTALSLKANKDLKKGSRVKIDILQGGTGRNVTLGSGSPGSTVTGAPVLTGVASDRDVLWLTWDGSAFVSDQAAWFKIVDAA